MAIPNQQFQSMLRAGGRRITYKDLAAMIDVSPRLVQQWVTEGEVPGKWEDAVRNALARNRDELQALNPLHTYTDSELLDEIARRLNALGAASRTAENGDEDALEESESWINVDPT